MACLLSNMALSIIIKEIALSYNDNNDLHT